MAVDDQPATEPRGGRRPGGFLAAAQFLTRIPIRLRAAPDLAAAVPWFPVVGALIGALVGGLAALLMEWTPATVAGAVAVLAGVAVTGAFHEDGLADTADALGGWDRAQRLEILKDSRHGSYGVAALCGSIVLRTLCLASLGPAAAVGGAVTSHSLGRGAAVAAMAVGPGPPRDGLGADYRRSLTRTQAAIGVAAAILIAVLAVGWWAIPLAATAGAAALIVGRVTNRSFGGLTGDALGAVEQVAECLVLVVVTGLASRHQVWWA